MDGFYNAPIVPVWVAFAITVLMLVLGCMVLKSATFLSRRAVLAPGFLALAFTMAAFALLWMPVWFIYGLMTAKFH